MRKNVLIAGMVFLGLALGQEFLTLGSGATTGVYFPVATGMAKLVNDANVGLRANARSTGGSVANINAIAAGEFEMALAQNDIAYYAYQGCCIAAFDGKPVKGIRALAALYPEVVHIVARADAGIRTVADLKGKRVVVGDVGSGTEQNARQILEAYGLRFEDLGQAIRVSATQGIQLVQDRRADALFYTVGLGASAIQQLALTTPIALVAVDLGKVQAIAKKYPFYVGFNIPGGTYKGVDVTTPTVAVQAMLIAAEKLSPDTVYRFMKAVFADQAAFKKIHPNLERFFDLSRAARGLPIPLHPGAERFYKEIGVLK
ncbi:MAG: TAXI family TRAP transporter solute-binding subunit [Thermus sp.]|uniref:TAXI family TRAP transporter solute-binding subunit n=1 Tax=Thermus sp. TaxID=275 RepID=UPI0025ED906B|nr:TAXI family TRAP transporter solute-binding subunit [Thermus sp.]MCS6867357.1 TAXI family TRAP transporter solute-binding subunit [Thermus sp.]MCS7218101.1 TAXI family TRAP transporter solute-binding subunit [Thermus sp.]MCX7849865.1 TAXI family TRAP transporter solute-binding subunit [Thermus sp.]MDW8017959.1 TAXI family TRAP transporter solute-binding subunit [Thermus sp.]MDW8357691.1 TAXI family TRAP transporter solute-binding subunit [Thermus sp.]